MSGKWTDAESGEYFREQLGTNRGFLVTFTTVDSESAEQGDYASTGWSDYNSCEPDEYDTKDGLSAVELAVRYLRDHGAINPSSSRFHPGVWYSTEFETEDCRTDEQTEYSCHPYNFSEAEQAEIFRAIVR